MRQTLLRITLAAALSSVILSAQSAETKVLRVGTHLGYSPFQFIETKSNKIVGFDIELMKKLAKKMNVKIQFDSLGFDGLIPALAANNIDVAISAITITPERAKRVLFTDPYYNSGVSYLVRKDDKDVYTSAKQFKNKIVCAQIGTTGAMVAAKYAKQVKIYNSMAESYLELKNKGCEAVFGDRPVNGYFMVSRRANKRFFSHQKETLSTEQFGIIVRKDNVELQQKLNKALADLRRSGAYDSLYKTWFGK